MAPQASISSIPPEVLLMVMRNFESPKEVAALSQTCKSMHEALEAHGSAILKDIIRRTIPAETLPDAVAACRASRILATWKSPSCHALAEEQARFIEDYARLRHTDPYPPRQPAPVDELKSVCHLQQLAESCIAEFREETFCNAAHKLQLKPSKVNRPLSVPERVRLQRAIFRLEIYRRLFPRPIPQPHHDQRETDDAAAHAGQRRLILQFLGLFPQWELEEMLTVHDFLLRTVSNLCGRLQYCVVLSMSPSSTLQSNEQDTDWAPPNQRAANLICARESLQRLQYRSPTGSGLRWIVGQGLRFIRTLVHLSRRNQFRVLRRIADREIYSELPETTSIGCFWGVIYADNEALMPPVAAECDDIDKPGAGWRWRVDNGGLRFNSGSAMDETFVLREMGYVIWDARRLKDEWGLCKEGVWPAQRMSSLVRSRPLGLPSIYPLLGNLGWGVDDPSIFSVEDDLDLEREGNASFTGIGCTALQNIEY